MNGNQNVKLKSHESYARLIEKAYLSHERSRSVEGITDADTCLARLYCYAFRVETIGTFQATRLAIENLPPTGPLATAYRARAVEALADLANQAMTPVPTDFRAVISTLHRYHKGVTRVLDSIEHDDADSQGGEISRIGHRFKEVIEQITMSGGIHLTQDAAAPQQASFIVPNLGITIVPLVYGEHHSWNLAYLTGDAPHVPTHRHHHGVEIHLGFNPTHGMTVLGGCCAAVDEGYAMPIPPGTDHGWLNTSDETHHVPFIFGSLRRGGWGVFLDVEPRTQSVDNLTLVDRDRAPFNEMVPLEREIARAEQALASGRTRLIPSTVTARDGNGGLELGVTRVAAEGFSFPVDEYRIVSVVRGRGTVSIEGITRSIRVHDHFGIPAGMKATLQQTDAASLVVLDALIRGADTEGTKAVGPE